MKRLLLILFVVVFLLAGAIFAALNANTVYVDLVVGSAEPKLFVLVLLVFASGFVLGFSAMALRMMSLRHEHRITRKKLKEAQEEVRNLRNMPLTDGA